MNNILERTAAKGVRYLLIFILWVDGMQWVGRGFEDLEATFADPALEVVVRRVINNPNRIILKTELLEITELDASLGNRLESTLRLTDLGGIENLVHLKRLNLSGDRNGTPFTIVPNIDIQDFSKLSVLRELEFLDLSRNNLTELQLTEGMISLQTLLLTDNSFASLDQIVLPGDLNQLKVLQLNFNRLTEVTIPSPMGDPVGTRWDWQSLERLNLANNQIETLHFQGSLGKLKELVLTANRLTAFDLEPDVLSEVEVLDLFFNEIQEVHLPPGMSLLKQLKLQQNPITVLQLSPGLTRLTALDLANMPMTQLALPVGMVGLEDLSTRDSQLETLFLPNDLQSLKLLDTSNCYLETLVLPSGMTQLEALNLSLNFLQELDLPEDMEQLRFLNLLGNELTRIGFPSSLTAMKSIDVSLNALEELVLPSELPNLGALDFSENQISRLTLPKELPELGIFNAMFNQLSHLNLPVHLPKLTVLNVYNNELEVLILPDDLNQLISMDLSNNRLTRIRMPHLASKLSVLDLHNNFLVTLTLPGKIDDLRYLQVCENPLLVVYAPLSVGLSSVDIECYQKESLLYHGGPLRVVNGLLHWEVGTLEFARQINGPWEEVSDIGPHPIDLSQINGFFRVSRFR